MPTIATEPLTASAFAPFGQVIEAAPANRITINAGMTERYNDLARIELAGPDARPMISLFRGQPYKLPIAVPFLERHPLGSQAFYPLSNRPFLVTVALDTEGTPGVPRSFMTQPGQGVNLAINTWHAVLTPLDAVSDFLVVDRGGDGDNLEIFNFPEPYLITGPT